MPANGCVKPFAGINLIKNKKTPTIDIFDMKVDLNPPSVKISGSFLYKSYRTSVNDLSIMKRSFTGFFVAQGCYQKEMDGIRTF